MPLESGRVEAISIKKMPEPDQFDNTHRINFLIKEGDQDTWYSLGTSKGGAYANKDIPELHRRDKIEFMYDINGDFKNVKRATMTLLEAAPAKGKISSNSGSPEGWAVGQVLNIMVEQSRGDFNKILDPNFMREQIINYKKAQEQIVQLWDAAQNEPQPRTQNNFDDDIPF